MSKKNISRQKGKSYSVKLSSSFKDTKLGAVAKSKPTKFLDFVLNVTSFSFELGATVLDRITAFEGVVIARAQYITGADQYCVQPRSPDGGATPALESRWFDGERLAQTPFPVVTLQPVRRTRSGRVRR